MPITITGNDSGNPSGKKIGNDSGNVSGKDFGNNFGKKTATIPAIFPPPATHHRRLAPSLKGRR